MTIINQSIYGNTLFQKFLGHNINIMEKWTDLSELLETDVLLKASLKEQVRRTLAQSNGCEYCKAKGKPEPNLFDAQTSVAVGFAQVCATYPTGEIPDFAVEVLKEEFSEQEISELCAFISFTIAQQYFGALMQLKAEENIE